MDTVNIRPDDRRMVLVTGASSEIGLECIRRFVRASHRILAVTRDPTRLAARLGDVGVATAEVQIVQADLTDFSRASTLLDESIHHAGHVDVVVNAVGSFSCIPALDLDADKLRSALDTNLVAPIVAMRAALPSMIKQRGGSIINIASAFGMIAPLDVRCLAYASAKAGLIHATRLLAAEVGRYRVRVNCVCPGVLSPASLAVPEDLNRLRDAGQLLDRQALPTFATAVDVAALVVHLASDEAGAITGAVMPVDGGMSAL